MVTTPASTTSNDAITGIFWKVSSAFIFTLMLTMVKLAGERYPVGELLFARNIFGLIPVLIFIVWAGNLRDALKTNNLPGHIRRAMAGMFAMGLWFAALQRLSFPEATAIVYAAPLMMVVLAATVLGETVRIYRWSAVGVGFVGVFIILVPQFEEGFDLADAAAVGAILALASAAFMSMTSIFVRQLARSESTSTIVLYFLIAGTAVTALTAPTWVMPDNWFDVMLLVGIGVTGGVGQLFLTQAFQHAEASLIAPFEYTSMIWVVTIGYFVFGEVPTIYVVIGGTIVIASGIFVILRERRLGLQRAERKVGSPLRP
ncbi:DMT family transporter [Acuticoccus sp. M5D2P5]|uniref:DMT family transporter n=1 Tax=Acuticoccus kalidii TaxID=2910977 RepID=UPI001F1723CD|nr:DMT family transporter [Acuticoccus kalidii]MCF3933574.1 DMT family transporter [Acuticoccus kalidii]